MFNLRREDIIHIRNLKFKWRGQVNNLLDIAELSVKKGEKVFLKGGSGSGKSSLLSVLAGIAQPQQGDIELLGRQFNNLSSVKRDEFRANHIGYIFQQFNLVPYLSIIENITLPCYLSESRKSNVLAQSKSLNKEAQRLMSELGIDGIDLQKKSVSQLSVGEQQRVAACRALIGNPEIILADEPTSSLDEGTQQAFISLLLKECKRYNTTLLFVSHDSRHTSLFERTIELKVENGHLSENVETGGVICNS